MCVANNYLTFLKEYNKLLERGIRNIFADNVSENFIWIDDIQNLVDNNLCETTLLNLFTENIEQRERIFTLQKPSKPIIEIPEQYEGRIRLNETRYIFEPIENEEDLREFQETQDYENLMQILNTYKRNKKFYSKLFRAYNDINNDSNIEIVLSVGLIQHSRNGNRDRIININQHLFHFPLEIQISRNNGISLSFLGTENPYCDYFFLNNIHIERDILNRLIDNFNTKIEEIGYQYIYNNEFREIIEIDLQQISENSEFINLITKPENENVTLGNFKILFSPAINIKRKKPRFFEKLINGIIDNFENNNESVPELFNLLIRNPENINKNNYPKSNYFIENLYTNYGEKHNTLNEKDFSVFFPLPYNKEQKKIYENYLQNRITVVTGPPGTGKSHTIVNIISTLLAEGKRVLVTAQTDKALESLLEKIPKTFDDLIFTKIELETDKTRFSLGNSIDNISNILRDDFNPNIEHKIRNLADYKREYLKSKDKILKVLEKEYKKITINDSFQGLRRYEIFEKLMNKNKQEYNWIKDEITLEQINDFNNLEKYINEYIELSEFENQLLRDVDIDVNELYTKICNFDFDGYIKTKKDFEELKQSLNIDNYYINEINIEKIIADLKDFKNSDIVIDNAQELNALHNTLQTEFDQIEPSEDYVSNLKFSNIIQDATNYLNDIESYLGLLNEGKEKVNIIKKFNSRYKELKYLEDIVLNGNACNNRKSLNQLKDYISKIKKINTILNKISEKGFNVEIDEDSRLYSKKELLKTSIGKVEINLLIINELETNNNLTTFTQVFNINIKNVEEIYQKALTKKDDIEKLQHLYKMVGNFNEKRREIAGILNNSRFTNLITDFYPIRNITDSNMFNGFKERLEEIIFQIEQEEKFNNAKEFLEQQLPNTLEQLKNVSQELITKENFEFAFTDNFFKKETPVNLQKIKEYLGTLNQRIYEIKSEILFDLAKDNFRQQFNNNEIDGFINLLNEYRVNFEHGNRGINERVRFQILARRNSAEISNKLSCWVMKFNDVLDSVGTEKEIFDCIIVDESSQLNFNSLILGYYAKNMIIVGDDKQTSPSSFTGIAGDDFEGIRNNYLEYLGTNKIQIRSDNSLFTFAKMVAGMANLSLKEHFRCVPEIIAFSNHHFYNNSLRLLKQINNQRLTPLITIFIENSYIEDKVVWDEIERIKGYLSNIINNPTYNNKTIGVVSLGIKRHTEKLKEIKEELMETFGNDRINEVKLIIDDPKKFQGDERDIILVSLGVALNPENNNSKPRAIIQNQSKLKEINVALSRAKEQMVLFHSVKAEDLRDNDFRLEILSFFNNENPIEIPCLELPDCQGDRNQYNSPNPFDSWFEYDIARELINRGYCYIQPQLKVKDEETYFNPKTNRETYVNFKLDLVVYNNGKRIAVECDGDPFHSLPEDVAYDIERQEFLERVGWKIYRILYSAYRRDNNGEIEKLIKFIKENTQNDETIPDGKDTDETDGGINPNGTESDSEDGNDTISQKIEIIRDGALSLRYFKLDDNKCKILKDSQILKKDISLSIDDWVLKKKLKRDGILKEEEDNTLIFTQDYEVESEKQVFALFYSNSEKKTGYLPR